ncbi:hypothetical protein GCM10010503_69230 [Streptomyces lucensis JCM 4490]|uniref:Uncharacterized protein n=1 Tax=Streptomyces lucensis JCM 4490 TaxID=1306176 RepID=A0A918JIR0_9ACTN|nr:hypothetical protein [Streptomyces lucensis]GGW82098.1 hypothetical protein GCM10010503_69230 [Streptomyces lucensis JCM 4490]
MAMTPYLLIKVSWVAGALVGVIPLGSTMGLAQWVLLNTVTIGMALIGIFLALALVRPWGMRLPAAPLLFCGWLGTGFLVSMLPYAALSSLVDRSDGGRPDHQGTSAPGWEAVLIQVSFVGMGIGLAIALPAYLRRRWPQTLSGRIGDRTRLSPSGAPERGLDGAPRTSAWLFAAGAVLSACWLYWAVGGTAGLAEPGERNADWRLLVAVFAVWALAGSAAAWATANGRPARLPRWLPTVMLWLGSGSLFAWSAWKLPFTAYTAFAGRAADSVMPENLGVAAAIHVTALVTGAAMLRALVRTYATPGTSS